MPNRDAAALHREWARASLRLCKTTDTLDHRSQWVQFIGATQRLQHCSAIPIAAQFAEWGCIPLPSNDSIAIEQREQVRKDPSVEGSGLAVSGLPVLSGLTVRTHCAQALA